ncbi:MAG: hypothetical protein HY706_12325 [Candidatus Hydrogenedentes bacterium]|nr:hypothetical protein [Candidatus Hydrogenedentota bacterium]
MKHVGCISKKLPAKAVVVYETALERWIDLAKGLAQRGPGLFGKNELGDTVARFSFGKLPL